MYAARGKLCDSRQTVAGVASFGWLIYMTPSSEWDASPAPDILSTFSVGELGNSPPQRNSK